MAGSWPKPGKLLFKFLKCLQILSTWVLDWYFILSTQKAIILCLPHFSERTSHFLLTGADRRGRNKNPLTYPIHHFLRTSARNWGAHTRPDPSKTSLWLFVATFCFYCSDPSDGFYLLFKCECLTFDNRPFVFMDEDMVKCWFRRDYIGRDISANCFSRNCSALLRDLY